VGGALVQERDVICEVEGGNWLVSVILTGEVRVGAAVGCVGLWVLLRTCCKF
jgi:hypothetical protein